MSLTNRPKGNHPGGVWEEAEKGNTEAKGREAGAG